MRVRRRVSALVLPKLGGLLPKRRLATCFKGLPVKQQSRACRRRWQCSSSGIYLHPAMYSREKGHPMGWPFSFRAQNRKGVDNCSWKKPANATRFEMAG